MAMSALEMHKKLPIDCTEPDFLAQHTGDALASEKEE
jgi:hypothetical protein